MTTITQIENAFLAWVTSIVDPAIDVLFADQADPRSDGTYVTLKLISGTARSSGMDEVRSEGNLVRVVGQREGTMNVQAYRDGSRQIALNLSDSLDRPTIVSLFDSQNIAIIEPMAVQNLTEFLETEFEERASFDVRFRTSFTVLDNPGTIGTVVETATIGNTVITSTITT